MQQKVCVFVFTCAFVFLCVDRNYVGSKYLCDGYIGIEWCMRDKFSFTKDG